jgi:predicted DNA-binding transcriptional regulator AlpA
MATEGRSVDESNRLADPMLYDIGQLSRLGLGSSRHIRRLTDAGRMPAPVRLGALLRWPARTGNPLTGIHDWIAAGCPDCRSLRRAVR